MDPAGQGMNWYAYCGNDPVNYADPSGLYHHFNIYYLVDPPDENHVVVLCCNDANTSVPDATYYFHTYGAFVSEMLSGNHPDLTADVCDMNTTIRYFGGIIQQNRYDSIFLLLGATNVETYNYENEFQIVDYLGDYVPYEPNWISGVWNAFTEGLSTGLSNAMNAAIVITLPSICSPSAGGGFQIIINPIQGWVAVYAYLQIGTVSITAGGIGAVFNIINPTDYTGYYNSISLSTPGAWGVETSFNSLIDDPYTVSVICGYSFPTVGTAAAQYYYLLWDSINGFSDSIIYD